MKNLLILLILAIFTFGCNNKENLPDNADKADNMDKPSEESNTTSTSAPQKYKIKSGIVTLEMENSMMGGKSSSVLYFDEYGAKECTENITEMEMMGQKIRIHNLSIVKDGFMYEIDMEKKTGRKMKFYGNSNPANMDFSTLSDKMKKKYNLKKEAAEVILNKTCEVYSIDYEGMKMKGKFSTWEGINLKSDMDMGGIKIKSIAKKFEENVAVPDSRFEIPENIKFEEL